MPLQDRAVETRKAIVRGAAAVFEDVGYGPASLQMVAETAEVTRGALYFHFKSKELLALAVIEDQHARTKESAADVFSRSLGPIETICALCSCFASLLQTDPVVRAGIRLTLESSTFGQRIRSPYTDWMQIMEQLTLEGQASGEISSKVDAGAFGRYLVASFTGVQMVSNVLTAREDLTERVEELAAFVRLTLSPSAQHEFLTLDELRPLV
ncbi:TetR/AcrR family transcriptional regulator [Arthrobacter sp. R1-13]